MKYYIIYYKDGSHKSAQASNDQELVRKYDLASRENLGCSIMLVAE